MRVIAMAACGLILTGLTAGAALAQEFSDPQGRLNFTIPARGDWQTEGPARELGGANRGLTISFSNASDRCHIQAVQRDATTVEVIKRTYGREARDEIWGSSGPVVASLTDNPGAAATLASSNVDTSGFWPVQRATFEINGVTVYATAQGRPDVEIRSFCHPWEAGGRANTAAYDAIAASIGTPRDAQWQAEYEASQAPAAPAATPPAT